MQIRSLSIIVPCYNERRTAAEAVRGVLSLDLGEVQKEVIVVDDGSVDGTYEELRQFEGRCRIIRRAANGGKGAAVRDGVRAATGEYLVVYDADLEVDPADIQALLAEAMRTGAEAVYGSRALTDRLPDGWKPLYLWGGKFMTALVNTLFGLSLTDVSSVYKLVRRERYLTLPLREDRFGLEVELTAHLAARGIPLSEVPVRYSPRSARGGKKLRARDGLRIALVALRVFLEERSRGTVRRFLMRYRDEALLFLVGFAAAFAAFGLIREVRPWDVAPPESVFIDLASNLVEYGVYADNDPTAHPLSPHSSYTPLYPIVIAPLVAVAPVLVLAFHWLLRGLLIVLSYRLALAVGASRRAAYALSFLLALEPYHLVVVNYATPETFFTVLLIAYVLFSYRSLAFPSRSASFSGGLLLGLVTLVRPVTQFLLVPHMIMAAVGGRRHVKEIALRASLVALGFGIVIAPWLVRNHVRFGAATISSLPAIQILNAAMPHYFEWREGADGASEQSLFDRIAELKAEASAAVGYDVSRRFSFDAAEAKIVMEEIVSPFLREHGLFLAGFYLTQLPFQMLTDNWRTALEHMTGWPHGAPTSLAAALSAARGDPSELIDTVATADAYMLAFIGGKAFWAGIYLLAAFGALVSLYRKGYRFRALAAAFFVVYLPFLSLPYLEARYRYPAAPFLMALAAVGLMALRSQGRDPLRKPWQKLKDFLAFPVRAFTMFEQDRWGFSSLATERFDYVARETQGYCLDVGCGKQNRFIAEFMKGDGVGIDVYPYEGLTSAHIVEDMTKFPFKDEAFKSVTFIADINHVPRDKRDAELSEAYRVLSPGGNIIITMGNPIAELAVHQVVYWYDRILGTNVDMDTERGMEEGEEYFLLDREIIGRLKKAGFTGIRKKYFLTQWGLNHLFVGWKRPIREERKGLSS